MVKNLSSNGAIAIFVKTPELSPIKTRLAEGIGENQAVNFYRLAVKAVASVVRQAQSRQGSLKAFWAVAEPGEISGWDGFDKINQGDGPLNRRLDRVYRALQKTYGSVVLLGADSPHLNAMILIEAFGLLKNKRRFSFVLGRSWDGGFYLFGGNIPIPKEIWRKLPCSHPQTAQKLHRMIENLGKVAELPPTFDVDSIQDLKPLGAALRISPDLTSEQIEVLNWLKILKREK